MSIKTTHHIDRATAIEVVKMKINSMSNAELEEVLEAFSDSKFRNYFVYQETPGDVKNHVISAPEDFFIEAPVDL